jgi:hypothetical protein
MLARGKESFPGRLQMPCAGLSHAFDSENMFLIGGVE